MLIKHIQKDPVIKTGAKGLIMRKKLIKEAQPIELFWSIPNSN